jgi:transcriptional regulator with XRE-family HTH domain
MDTVMHKDEDKLVLNESTKVEDSNNNNRNQKITKNNKIKNDNNNNYNTLNSPNNTTNFTSTNNTNQHQQQQSQLDIVRENRLSQIIGLYSKGLTQSEIAQKMNVNQSTISRDLQYLQQEAKKSIWKYLNEDILFEYLRFIVGNNEISKKLWEIVQDDENASAKDKTNALSLLNQSYTKRLEILMDGVESFKNVKKNISEIEEHDKIENDPLLKLSTKLSEIDKGFLFRKR